MGREQCLDLGLNAAYTDAEYDSFPGAECYSGTPVIPDPETGTCNLAGLPLIFAPDIKAALFADFQVDDAFGGWDFGGRLISLTPMSFIPIFHIRTMSQLSHSRFITPCSDSLLPRKNGVSHHREKSH